MNEEILRVMKMLEDGKIDSEEAAKLIEALNKKEEQPKVVSHDDRMFKIKISDHTGDNNVNVNLPIKFLKALIKSTGSIPLNIKGVDIKDIDMQALMDAIDSGFEGKFVDIKSDDGDVVEITIE